MAGQTKAALWQRETGRRDYDRPISRFAGQIACWQKSVNGGCDGVVVEVDETTAIVKGVPAATSLCLEHGFMSDEELELAELITLADRERFRAGKELHLAESVLDLKHEQKNVDREDEKWGNG